MINEQTLYEWSDRLVTREVHLCLSSIVSTLAQESGIAGEPREYPSLCDQAFELFSPIPDYEEAAIQEGYTLGVKDGGDRTAILVREPGSDPEHFPLSAESEEEAWREICDMQNIDPYEREVFEHWAVSSWLADKLEEQGEKVDRDFGGLNVWARTTTGQAISMDHVIQKIAANMHKARMGVPLMAEG